MYYAYIIASFALKIEPSYSMAATEKQATSLADPSLRSAIRYLRLAFL